MKKFRNSNLIMSIITSCTLVILLITLVFAWYTSKQQIGEIDATTKNVAVEYKFDDSTNKNVMNYNVKNLSFFDVDSTQELKYIKTMAVKMEINLKNNSSNEISYKVIFNSTKTETERNSTVVSRAYIDCVYYDLNDSLLLSRTTTIQGIKGLTDAGVTYSTVNNNVTATKDSLGL